ncbi:hypothetical protein BDW62DRAFT_174155 [Aspergillus aurantiobrunneus]
MGNWAKVIDVKTDPFIPGASAHLLLAIIGLHVHIRIKKGRAGDTMVFFDSKLGCPFIISCISGAWLGLFSRERLTSTRNTAFVELSCQPPAAGAG